MSSRFARPLFLLSCVLWAAPLPARSPNPAPLTASEFADLIQRISEPGGYFWNDNFVSNEASYLHPLSRLKEFGIGGGVYIGVGPNQNFTYIAKLRPRYAFILDVRRQNFLEHLLFKSVFHFSRSRGEYLSILLSRPIPEAFEREGDYSINELVRHFQFTSPDPLLYRRNRARFRLFLTMGCRVPLGDQDLATIDKIHKAFYLRGLAIKYDYIPVPTYGEFLLEKDLDGRRGNFLNSSEDFKDLRRLHEENRIIPLVGDFAGSRALRELAAYLRDHSEKVTVFYTSNVEQYLVRSMVWHQFIANVRELPLDDRAVFIRAYWNNRTSQAHPEGIYGYAFTQILQWAKPFLENFDPARSYTYWDIVTHGAIRLK